MDISALSTALSQGGLQQAVGLRVMAMAKNQAVQQGQELVQMMERSVQPGVGGQIDIKA